MYCMYDMYIYIYKICICIYFRYNDIYIYIYTHHVVYCNAAAEPMQSSSVLGTSCEQLSLRFMLYIPLDREIIHILLRVHVLLVNASVPSF